MNSVYTIGETVLDIIIESIDKVQIKPGGSMLNTSISLGRLSSNVNHISIIANDMASGLIQDFLLKNGVSINYLNKVESLKTSLALAFLDENKNASYSFYKDDSQKIPILSLPELEPNDIIHYGSFFSLNDKIHDQLLVFLQNGRKCHSILLYDPNFRIAHLPKLNMLFPLIEKNLGVAHIVKASNEDMENIFGIKTVEESWKIIENYGVEVFIYTMGAKGVWVYTSKGSEFVPSKNIEIVSTIGAGDTFSAGIIHFINRKLKQNIPYHEFSLAEWKACLEMANLFAAETCQSYDNYLSLEFANNYINV